MAQILQPGQANPLGFGFPSTPPPRPPTPQPVWATLESLGQGIGGPGSVGVDSVDSLIPADSSALTGQPGIGGADTLVPTDAGVMTRTEYYSAIVLADGPEAYWPMEETSGTTFADSTGHGHTATLVGTVTKGVSGPNALPAAQFDGSTAYATVATLTNFPTSGAYSIEAWGNPTGAATLYGILGYGTYGTTNEVNAFRTNGATGLTNYWWGQDLALTGLTSFTGGWHHFCVTYDGTTRTIYLDGLAVGHDTPSGHIPTLANCTLAATNTGPAEKWTGALGRIAIYASCLSATQVATHHSVIGGPTFVSITANDVLVPADTGVVTPFILMTTADTLVPADASSLVLLITVTLAGADTLAPTDGATWSYIAAPTDAPTPTDTGRLWQTAHSAPIVITTVDALVGPVGAQVGYTVDVRLTASSLPLSSTTVFAQLQTFRTQVPTDATNFPSGYPTDLSVLCGGQPIDCDVAVCRTDLIIVRFALQSPLAASTTDGHSYTLVWGSTAWVAPRNLSKVFPWFDDFLDSAVNAGYSLFGTTAAQSGNGILTTAYHNDGTNNSGIWVTSLPNLQGLDMEISVDLQVALAQASWTNNNSGDAAGVTVRDANDGSFNSMGTNATPPNYVAGGSSWTPDILFVGGGSSISNRYGTNMLAATWYTYRFQAVSINLATLRGKQWTGGWLAEQTTWDFTQTLDVTTWSQRASASLVTPRSTWGPDTTITPSFRYWRLRIAVVNPPTVTTSTLIGADTLVPADAGGAALLLASGDTLTPRDTATALLIPTGADVLVPADAEVDTLLLGRTDVLVPADSQGSALDLQLVGKDTLVPADVGTIALSATALLANTGDTLTLVGTWSLTLLPVAGDTLTPQEGAPSTLLLGQADTLSLTDRWALLSLLHAADTLLPTDRSTVVLNPAFALSTAGLYEPMQNVVRAGLADTAVTVTRLAPSSITYVSGGTTYTDTLPGPTVALVWGGAGATQVDLTSATYATFVVPAFGGVAALYICPETNLAALQASMALLPVDRVTRQTISRYQNV